MSGDDLLLAIVLDFLEPGETEPLQLSKVGPQAIAMGVRLADQLGALAEELESVALYCYDLEGRGDSPRAAQAVRRALVEAPEVGRTLVASGVVGLEAALKKLGKRRAFARSQVEAKSKQTIGALTMAAPITG